MMYKNPSSDHLLYYNQDLEVSCNLYLLESLAFGFFVHPLHVREVCYERFLYPRYHVFRLLKNIIGAEKNVKELKFYR